MTQYIAERKLHYTLKGRETRKEFRIKIGVPYLVTQGMVDFTVTDEFYGCHVEVEEIDEKGYDVYGADSIQAINLASNIEPLLRRLQKKYDLYYITGESYFDDTEEEA